MNPTEAQRRARAEQTRRFQAETKVFHQRDAEKARAELQRQKRDPLHQLRTLYARRLNWYR